MGLKVTFLHKKMFYLLLFFSLSEPSQYSLIPPFVCDNGTEIGNWTLRQNANPSKRILRLSSHISNNGGAICQRVPTYSRDWSLTAEIFADLGTGGEGFSFFHTKELCTTDLLSGHGLFFWLNTSGTARRPAPFYFYNVSDKKIDLKNLEPKCVIDYYVGNPISIRITKQFDKITVESNNPVGGDKWTPCFNETVQNMISEGYFSVASRSGENNTDDHEVYNISIETLSPMNRPAEDNMNIVNRKYLDMVYFTRRQRKEKRRQNMKTVFTLVNETKDKNSRLDGNVISFKNAYVEISEAIRRLRMSFAYDDIEDFIKPELKVKVAYMMNVTETAISVREATKNAVKALWNNTADDLKKIAVEIKEDMEKAREEAINFTKTALSTKKSQNYLIKKLNKKENIGNNQFNKVLSAICIIELTGYILFFLYQRFLTDKMKKLD